MVRTPTIHSLNNFRIYFVAGLAIVIMLYITLLVLIYNWNIVPFFFLFVYSGLTQQSFYLVYNRVGSWMGASLVAQW